MGKETHKRFKELSDEGDACLQSLRNIDKRVGQAFLHLKEVSRNRHDSNATVVMVVVVHLMLVLVFFVFCFYVFCLWACLSLLVAMVGMMVMVWWG